MDEDFNEKKKVKDVFFCFLRFRATNIERKKVKTVYFLSVDDRPMMIERG